VLPSAPGDEGESRHWKADIERSDVRVTQHEIYAKSPRQGSWCGKKEKVIAGDPQSTDTTVTTASFLQNCEPLARRIATSKELCVVDAATWSLEWITMCMLDEVTGEVIVDFGDCWLN